MKLEYLLIFEPSGLPIFSNCFGGFCGKIATDEALFSGFLSALSTMPSMFGDSTGSLQSVEMGFTKLYFTHAIPQNQIICTGFHKKSLNEDKNIEKTLNEINSKITNLLNTKYKDIDWNAALPEDRENFKHDLYHNILEPELKGGFQEKCLSPHDSCAFDAVTSLPMSTNEDKGLENTPKPLTTNKNIPMTLWDRITYIYKNHKYTFIEKIIFKTKIINILINSMMKKDYKKYEERTQKQTTNDVKT